MKKILLAVLLSFAVASGFAAGSKTYSSFGFHFSTPFMFEFGSANGEKNTGITNSVAFGINATNLYSEKIGIYAALDIMLPLSITNYQTSNGKTESTTVTRDDYRALWGMSCLMGPAIVVSKSEKNMFLISPGVHFNMLCAEAAATLTSYTLGVGANFQYNLFFGSNGYFNFGGDLAFDFLGWASLSGENYSVNSVTVTVVPRIGVGFRYR